MEIGRLDRRTFKETIQNFNMYYNKDISENVKLRELEDLSNADLQSMINLAKDIKNTRP